ncbi:MAG: NIL domain-containing protein [Planctomycetota bacterium]
MAIRDNRKDNRIFIKGGMVQYKEAGGGLFAIFKGSSDPYPIMNISMRGIRFLTTDVLSNNARLTFTIEIPMLGGEPLRADGRVAWIQKSDRYKANIIGVQFNAMTKASIQRLKNLVSFLGNRVKVKQTIKILFSEQQRQQPILWQIARDYNVVINIKEGTITDHATWLLMEINGEKEEVQHVLKYLKEGGSRIIAVSASTVKK